MADVKSARAGRMVEEELKFDVDRRFDLPDLRLLVGATTRLAEQLLHTTYFDTADGRLRGAGISLRHRLQEDEVTAPSAVPAGRVPHKSAGVWTLKLPVPRPDVDGAVPAMVRTEMSWAGTVGKLPAEALGVVAGIVRREPLKPIAQLTAQRRRLQLRASASAEPWAEIDDDYVTVSSGPASGQRFRQIEVELLDREGAPAGALAAVAAQLQQAGAKPSSRSKIEIGLGPPSTDGGIGREQTARADVAGLLTHDTKRLLYEDLLLRASAPGHGWPDRSNVHDTRVAVRRLRSDLKMLGPLLDPIWVSHTTSELRWAAGLLGQVRDLDVLRARVEAHADETDAEGTQELLRLLLDRRAEATATLGESLRADRWTSLLDRLHAASTSPPTMPDAGAGDRLAGATFSFLVSKRWKAYKRRMPAASDQPGQAQLHKLRIQAKRLRYSSEAATPVVGKRARRTAKAAKGLQTVLGEIHDAASAAGQLRQLAQLPSITPAAAFVAGRIAGHADNRAADLERCWRREAARVRRAAKSWLT